MKKYLGLYLLLCLFNASAVHLNPQGLGEVLIVPYYTVNNSLNTLVTVTNTKEIAKAVKVNIREGLNGHAVLSYNVYLDAFDTWSFVFVPTQSTIAGNEGQDSAYQISTDNSCVPFLNKQRQEFLPFQLLDGPSDLGRSREGFIEIIEMGELTGEAAAFVNQGNVGVPDNCAGIEAAWQSNGIWDVASGADLNENINPSTGGLMAEANLINVAEGINFPIPTVALSDFFADGSIAHTDPGDISLSLNAAEPQATVITDDKTYQLAFDSGIDAVSAVLMTEKLTGSFAIDSVVAGKSQAMFIQPTRRFYIGEQGNNNQPPYNQMNDQNMICSLLGSTGEVSPYGGTLVSAAFWSRDSQLNFVTDAPTPCRPPPGGFRNLPGICDNVSVWEIRPEGTNIPSNSALTGSNNSFLSLVTFAENGFFNMNFINTRPLLANDINTNEEVQLIGLPVIGITLQQATNANAGAGLLAQYGASQRIMSSVRVFEQTESLNYEPVTTSTQVCK